MLLHCNNCRKNMPECKRYTLPVLFIFKKTHNDISHIKINLFWSELQYRVYGQMKEMDIRVNWSRNECNLNGIFILGMKIKTLNYSIMNSLICKFITYFLKYFFILWALKSPYVVFFSIAVTPVSFYLSNPSQFPTFPHHSNREYHGKPQTLSQRIIPN